MTEPSFQYNRGALKARGAPNVRIGSKAVLKSLPGFRLLTGGKQSSEVCFQGALQFLSNPAYLSFFLAVAGWIPNTINQCPALSWSAHQFLKGLCATGAFHSDRFSGVIPTNVLTPFLSSRPALARGDTKIINSSVASMAKLCPRRPARKAPRTGGGQNSYAIGPRSSPASSAAGFPPGQDWDPI